MIQAMGRSLNFCLRKFNNFRPKYQNGVNVVYKSNCDQLFIRISPQQQLIPFQLVPSGMFRSFSNNAASPGGGNGGPKQEMKGDLFDKLDKITFLLFYVPKIDEDDIQQLSALYMQATQGPCKETAPRTQKGSFDERGYWERWKKLGDMTKEDAAKQYMEIAKKYVEGVQNKVD